MLTTRGGGCSKGEDMYGPPRDPVPPSKLTAQPPGWIYPREKGGLEKPRNRFGEPIPPQSRISGEPWLTAEGLGVVRGNSPT